MGLLTSQYSYFTDRDLKNTLIIAHLTSVAYKYNSLLHSFHLQSVTIQEKKRLLLL